MGVDLRRFQRYKVYLRCYFPKEGRYEEVLDVSHKGCFIKTDLNFKPGEKIYFEVEIPDIGFLPIYGQVVTKNQSGINVEIIYMDRLIRLVWNYYLKTLLYIDEAKKVYEKWERKIDNAGVII
jgi:hypothetical protein